MPIEVGVVPEIGGLPDAAPTMPVDLAKPAVFGTVGKVVTEVPLAKHPRRVTAVGQQAAKGDLILSQHRSPIDRVPDARAVGPVPGHQGRPRRRTGGRHVIVRETRRLRCQRVDMWSLDHGIPSVSEIAVALVVGNHQHNVGAWQVCRGGPAPDQDYCRHHHRRCSTRPHRIPLAKPRMNQNHILRAARGEGHLRDNCDML